MPDFGFEIYRSDGSLALSTRESILRLVHIESISGTFNGTFSVPDFNAIEDDGLFIGRGFFYVQYDIRGESDAPGQPAFGTMILPSLNWDNSAKEMSVQPASIPSGWPFRARPNYDIIFCHFR